MHDALTAMFGLAAAVAALIASILNILETKARRAVHYLKAGTRTGVEVALDKTQLAKTINWIKRLDESGVRHVPDTVIRWYVNLPHLITTFVRAVNDFRPKSLFFHLMFGSTAVIQAFFVIALKSEDQWQFLAACLSLVCASTLYGYLFRALSSDPNQSYVLLVLSIPRWLVAIAVMPLVGNMIAFFKVFTAAPPQVAALLLPAMAPVFTLSVISIAYGINKFLRLQTESRLFHYFGVSVLLSVTTTSMAFVLGHVIEPSSPVPRTVLMVGNNIIFDVATLFVTFTVLEYYLRREGLLLLLIFVDVFLAAVFAFCAGYIGLLGSTQALTPSETMNVILFLTPSGATMTGGDAIFWAIHTTFLPTLGYCLFIIFAFTIRWQAQPILVHKGEVERVKANPLEEATFTEDLLAHLRKRYLLIAVVFAVASGLVKVHQYL